MSGCEPKKSTHRVEIVPVRLEPHGNADSLSVIPVWGFSYVGRTADWVGVTKAAYLPPDSVVDVTRPEFAFLVADAKSDGKVRIRARKLRGVVSFGLMIPVPDDTPLGEDWAERLGVEHYDPVPTGSQNRGGLQLGGEVASPPDVYTVKYDVEAGRRYSADVFVPGELVVVTEKIHGASGKYVFHDGKMYVGSRNEFKKEYPDYSHITVELLEPKVGRERAEEIVKRIKGDGSYKATGTQQNMWWQALDATPSLRNFCETHPGVVVYGEVYGACQDLNYGHIKGRVSFAVFDIMVDGRWLDFEEAEAMASAHGVPWVPIISRGMPFDFNTICDLAEGKSMMSGASNVREGVVVKPVKERWDKKVGRVNLKWVGAGYLERSK